MTAESPDAAAVHVRAAMRRFGAVPVLRGIDLDVQHGECLAIFGANGAGKSTLLRMLAGLVRADSGVVQVLGCDVPGGGSVRRRIGYLGHDSFLYRDLDARENLEYYARLFGVKDRARPARLLAEVGLERAAGRKTGTYSRGMVQRLALARAVLHEPELLLLDEPLTGLDPEGTALLARLLASAAERGVTVVMATHDVDRALESARRAVVLSRGRVAWDSGHGNADAAAVMQAWAQCTRTPAGDAAA